MMFSTHSHTKLRHYSQLFQHFQCHHHHTPYAYSYTIASKLSTRTIATNPHSRHHARAHPSFTKPILLPFHPFCTSHKDDDKPNLKFSFRNTMHTIRTGNIGTTEWRRLWDFTKKEKNWILGGIACMAVSTSVTMTVPAAFGYIIDIATGAKNDGFSLSELSVLFSTLFVTGGVFNAMRVYAFTRVGHNIVRRVRHSLFDNITRQEVEFFDRTSTGELINRLSADTAVMGESLGGLQLSSLLRSFTQIVGSFSVMMYLSPDLTFVMTAIVPVGVLASIAYGRFVRDTQKKTQDALAKSTAFAEEKLSYIRTVRYFAKEDEERVIYSDKINAVYDLAMLQTKGSSVFFGSTGAVGNIFLLGVLLYGAHLVEAGLITSGLLTSCLLYSVYIAMSAVNITSSFAGIMRGIGASSRVFELMDRETQINSKIGTELVHCMRGEVMFNSVSFQYPTRQNAMVLKDFTLSVPCGKAVAIVGESGSGKSTVISLLLRFYDVVDGNGTLCIDGYNVKDLKPDFIRKQIGVVSQEPVLFQGTIKDNIIYGLSDNEEDSISDEAIYKAAKESNAHDFISEFPDGYMTQIGEKGMNLSGGQKQRIAIARALIKKPSILLLDEATSALDSASEQLVADALEKSMKKRTTIVIAHRLSTIKNADIIAVVKNGAVIETGSHNELVANQDSYYSGLIQRQLY